MQGTGNSGSGERERIKVIRVDRETEMCVKVDLCVVWSN